MQRYYLIWYHSVDGGGVDPISLVIYMRDPEKGVPLKTNWSEYYLGMYPMSFSGHDAGMDIYIYIYASMPISAPTSVSISFPIYLIYLFIRCLFPEHFFFEPPYMVFQLPAEPNISLLLSCVVQYCAGSLKPVS